MLHWSISVASFCMVSKDDHAAFSPEMEAKRLAQNALSGHRIEYRNQAINILF